ncbi:MAG: squalene/phytoene synthase family protein [Verrucomicrobia bacterium]|nr:squalene/phytoene synthase family protein [Verrucomicrobiota bacterium]
MSRSFYLSIRFLPKKIRPTIAIGYLLARASDTIADTNGLPAEARTRLLTQVKSWICSGIESDRQLLKECIKAQPQGAERDLLAALEKIVGAKSLLPLVHQQLLEEVLAKIIQGQLLDLERFELVSEPQALPDDSSLEEYTYLVAGCVGEFWTKLCLLEWPHYARVDRVQIMHWGKRFGQGLQLVNILRDFSTDIQSSRCYLPIAEMEKARSDPASVRENWMRWLERASLYLKAGWDYTISVRPARVRFACAVPVLIGIRTLQLLKDQPVRPGIKISRQQVRWIILLSVVVGWFGLGERMIYAAFAGKTVQCPD